MGTKKCVERGSGCRESEYEVSFDQPSDPETSGPLNSPFRARNPERSSNSTFPHNVGLVGQNLGSRGIYTQINKVDGYMYIFFSTFKVAKFVFF